MAASWPKTSVIVIPRIERVAGTRYPIGQLTRIVENAVTTTYCYDSRGNVSQKRQAIAGQTDTVKYYHSVGNRLQGLIYPDGSEVLYPRDADGRVSGVGYTLPSVPWNFTNASSLITAITYAPFGPITSLTFANGETITYGIDANYQSTGYALAVQPLSVQQQRDVSGDVTQGLNTWGDSSNTTTFSYDALRRLIGAVETGNTTSSTSYTYNLTGDRLSETGTGDALGSYTYAAGTHRLTGIGSQARTYDAAGNTTGIATGGISYGYGYDARNRLAVAQVSGATVATYAHNALGERISKLISSTATHYDYDEGHHLLAESTSGSPSRDYLWLDDLPIGVIDTTGAGASSTSVVSSVYADAQGTPRIIADASNNLVWLQTGSTDRFGWAAPFAGSFTYNLRYPGQYLDQETGLYYNLNRNYDPATGRYEQADPLGLDGGMGLYLYGLNNPLSNVDPLGLCPNDGYPEGAGGVVCDGNGGFRIANQDNSNTHQCTQAHEQSHIDDVKRWAPNICKGAPNGYPYGNDLDQLSKQFGSKVPSYPLQRSECKAFRASLQCDSKVPGAEAQVARDVRGLQSYRCDAWGW